MPLSPPLRDKLALAALAAATVGCAMTNFGESLWIDELHTAWTVGGALGDVLPRAAEGNQGPLYFWLLWLWTKSAGLNEITLRLPSLLPAIGLPLVVYAFVRRFDRDSAAGRLAPLFAATLAATDMYTIYYAQEARPYAWVLLGAVLHVGALLAWLERPTAARWWLLVLGAIGLFHLHYTTELLFAAEGTVLLVAKLQRRESWKFHLRDALLVPLVVAALCAPSLPHIRMIAERRKNWEAFIDPPRWFDFWWTFPAALAIFVVLAGAAVRRYRRSQEETLGRLPLIVALWLFVPLTIAFVCTRLQWAPLFYYRYLLVALPASWILAALALRAFPGRWAPYCTAVVILAAWLQQQGPLRSWWDHGTVLVARNEDWRGAVARLNELAAENAEPIVVDPDLIESKRVSDASFTPGLRSLLLSPVRSLYPLRVADERLYTIASLHDQALTQADYERLNQCSGAWWICRNMGPHVIALSGGGRTIWFYSEGVPGDTFGNVWVGRMVRMDRPTPKE